MAHFEAPPGRRDLGSSKHHVAGARLHEAWSTSVDGADVLGRFTRLLVTSFIERRFLEQLLLESWEVLQKICNAIDGICSYSIDIGFEAKTRLKTCRDAVGALPFFESEHEPTRGTPNKDLMPKLLLAFKASHAAAQTGNSEHKLTKLSNNVGGTFYLTANHKLSMFHIDWLTKVAFITPVSTFLASSERRSVPNF